MCCCGQNGTIPLEQVPREDVLTIRSRVCHGCRHRRQADGVCQRTGLHAMSAVVRGRVCPIGKHTTGEILHWLKGSYAAFKVAFGLTPEFKGKAARLKACRKCDRLDRGKCLACGCNVDLKASDENQTCPMGKWE